MTTSNQSSSGQTNQSSSGQRGNFPLDDLTYDLVTVLYEKSKGLEAYDKYLRDAQGDPEVSQIFEQIRQQDAQHIQRLQQCLQRLIGNQQQGAGGQSSGGASGMSQSAGGATS